MRRRATPWVAGALLAAAVLSGCDLGKVESQPASLALDLEDLQRTLLTGAFAGDQYTAKIYTPDLRIPSPGCLTVFDAVSRSSWPRWERVAYVRPVEKDGGATLPRLSSLTGTFTTVEAAEEALPAIRTALASCTEIDEVADSLRWKLNLTHDDQRLSAAVDDQVNLFARGHVVRSAKSLELIMMFSAIRVGNNVVITNFTNAWTGSWPEATMTRMNQRVVDNLLAVTAGEPAPEGPGLNLSPGGRGSGAPSI